MAAARDNATSARIRRRLLRWFDRQRRDMPWRRSADPYGVWLSEMMLQQTQVATVVPFYERFLARFPTVRDLAGADLDDVLRLWAGLGYYARARNLHKAAKVVVAEHGGRFPDTVDALRSLPGVGEYSAGAVASIAFNVRTPAIDGNVVRVVARLGDLAVNAGQGQGRAAVRERVESLLPRLRCGDFNQALMELGATVCLPREAARCGDCPLNRDCQAHAAGTVAKRPVASAKRPPTSETHVVAAIEGNGRWLVVQRPGRGLWGGLWELPTAVANGESSVKLAARLARTTADAPCTADRRRFCDLRHQLTHRTIRFVGHRCRVRTGGRTRVRRGKAEESARTQWLPLRKLDGLGMSAAMRKIVAALRELTVDD